MLRKRHVKAVNIQNSKTVLHDFQRIKVPVDSTISYTDLAQYKVVSPSTLIHYSPCVRQKEPKSTCSIYHPFTGWKAAFLPWVSGDCCSTRHPMTKTTSAYWPSYTGAAPVLQGRTSGSLHRLWLGMEGGRSSCWAWHAGKASPGKGVSIPKRTSGVVLARQ